MSNFDYLKFCRQIIYNSILFNAGTIIVVATLVACYSRYPDEKAGQVPIAFVVRTPGSTIDESLIKEFVAKEVAPYKKLRQVSFIDSIPKNATGKVLRKELVKLALSNVASSRL